ncbi:protocadherin fat 1-like [Plakobranchus ocellatus]|uniref:Protocadherin fat 1-like n=1 Tax=Plakobranchus ocellatus TaxID=259542 RepID=A0AAV3XYT4_9GAST|nr:protocadherin fat 1-like [Plakobranchus ocellatus]
MEPVIGIWTDKGSKLSKIACTIRTSQVLDRETKAFYWLTVIAQDRALVPRFARLEVLITVDDVNDNIPQSLEPAYYASVPENLGGIIQRIVQIQASDGDYDGSQQLAYSITGGNSGQFFAIDEVTANILGCVCRFIPPPPSFIRMARSLAHTHTQIHTEEVTSAGPNQILPKQSCCADPQVTLAMKWT